MKKVDLHVHSRFSVHPSEWFLQRLGTRESYTEPEEIYRIAKKRGMSFVTITDHNQIDGVMKLKELHPRTFLQVWRLLHISLKMDVKFMCLYMG